MPTLDEMRTHAAIQATGLAQTRMANIEEARYLRERLAELKLVEGEPSRYYAIQDADERKALRARIDKLETSIEARAYG